MLRAQKLHDNVGKAKKKGKKKKSPGPSGIGFICYTSAGVMRVLHNRHLASPAFRRTKN